MQFSRQDLVIVHILVFNHRDLLRSSIEGVLGQSYPAVELIISDNGSGDGSAELVAEKYPFLKLIRNRENLGYSEGHNRVIRSTRGTYFLPLNPDAVLAPHYIQELTRALARDRSAGLATGKLYRNEDRVLDSTGMFFTPSLRHLDRGSNEKDRGQYQRPEYVFGASGAAPLLKREMMEDIQVEGEVFDRDFFAYREDADLCWRAQLLGWKTVYVPAAVAYHTRRVLPSNRRTLPVEINLHSVKNRFLMRIKNLTWGVGWRTFPYFALRDLLIIAYIALLEPSSWKAFVLVARLLPGALRKRRKIMTKRTANAGDLAKWFSWTPHSELFPLERTE